MSNSRVFKYFLSEDNWIYLLVGQHLLAEFGLYLGLDMENSCCNGCQYDDYLQHHQIWDILHNCHTLDTNGSAKLDGNYLVPCSDDWEPPSIWSVVAMLKTISVNSLQLHSPPPDTNHSSVLWGVAMMITLYTQLENRKHLGGLKLDLTITCPSSTTASCDFGFQFLRW